MAKLYYGNGECTIEGSEIRGVEIRYRGYIKTEKTANDNFVMLHRNNAIMLFPLGEGYLNELFNYNGTLKILSVIVADNNGERVACKIKRVMDYSELIDSTAETMTTLSEDLSAGHISSKKIVETPQIIENLQTKDKAQFFLQDGSIYEGAYHIHLKDSSCMTGSVHGENSQDLYFKQVRYGKIIDKLIPTKNPSHVPPASKLTNNARRRRK